MTGSVWTFDRQRSDLIPRTILVLAALAGLLAFLSPNLYEPWLSFHAELWMATAAILASGVVLTGDRSRRVGVPPFALGCFAAALVPAAQGAAGTILFFGDVWMAALYLLGAGLAAWVAWIACDRWSVQTVLGATLDVFLVAGVASVFIALCQWQGLEYMPYYMLGFEDGLRPGANLGQPNLLATLLVLGLIAVAERHRRGSVGAPVALLAVTFLGFGISMTQSRTALLEVVLVGGTLAWFTRSRRSPPLGPAKIAVATLVVLALPFVWEAIRHLSPFGITARNIGDVAVAGVRPLHWTSLWDAVLRQPLGGYGWSQVGSAQYAVAPDHPATHETLAHAHNLVVELLVVNGLPLGLLLVALLGWWFLSSTIRIADTATALAFAAVLAVFVHAMLEYPLHYADFLLPTAAWIGCVSFGTRTASAASAIPSLPRAWPTGLWLILTVAVAVTAIDYLDFEADRRHLRFKAANIGTPVAKWERSDRIVLTQLGAFWNFLIEPERRGMSSEEIDAMQHVVLRFPSVENMVRYAAALALNGRPQEATAVLTRACRMTPLSHCRTMSNLWRFMGSSQAEIAAIRFPGVE